MKYQLYQFSDNDATMVELERVLHRHVLQLLARNVVIDREIFDSVANFEAKAIYIAEFNIIGRVPQSNHPRGKYEMREAFPHDLSI